MSPNLLARAVSIYLALVVGNWLATALIGTRQTSECEARVVVEIVNGCGLKGAAEEVATWLGGLGFDVLFVGNADDFEYEETIIVDRCGDDTKLAALTSVLGTDNVVHQVRISTFVDATVIVGGDFKELATRR